ncbi:CRISPR-associated protein CasA/Cse1, type TIGR02547 [Leptospira noguchii serovar Autumnalis str. ZUN142]|uniref:CRISPR-associated protein CasA/Cse1, type TIGR02547 n=2 Tax=Leptospira noguchii TaxID=28182 RepID=M6U3J1_9LEPT|nr:CRISPR-associated protein CasA/Cse1, type TIGR02547 [Leptospira noguchii serovar Autumnalis str. ZUN142]
MVAKKKIQKKATPPKSKISPKENMPDFSFNLLTEPWIPVIHETNKKQLLNLNDFLRTAHKLERFDFPLPGLETAVIRFLVALVHIVGAPETLKEWEEKLSKGKFEESFIKELNEKYFDKLDLFSKKDPFMQDLNLHSTKTKSASQLIFSVSTTSVNTHWSHFLEENQINLSPAISIPIILLSFTMAMSGGRGYFPGINREPPILVFLKGSNTFESIYLNVINNKLNLSIHENHKLIGKPETGFTIITPKEYPPKSINIQTGLLWKSRSILLIPEKNEQNLVCDITGIKGVTIIKRIHFEPPTARIKQVAKNQAKPFDPKKNRTNAFWSDPMTIRVEEDGMEAQPLRIQSNELPTLPSWHEYPSALYITGNLKEKSKKFAPPIIHQLNNLTERKRPKCRISIACVSFEPGQAKIYEYFENEYYFDPKFLSQQDKITAIESFINKTSSFEKYIQDALQKAFKIPKKSNNKPPSFQSSYWFELGSNFEKSLQRLSSEDDPNLVQNEWNELLANHVRKTFYKHTEKLIRNPKNLKQYQAGYQFLEKRVQGILLKHKRESK